MEAEDATPSPRRRLGPGSQRKRPLKNGGSTRTPAPPNRPTSRRLSSTSPPRTTGCRFSPSGFRDLPQPELRALFDSLQLQIAFQPQTRAIDVEVTLVADLQPDRDNETSQVWSVPWQDSNRHTSSARVWNVYGALVPPPLSQYLLFVFKRRLGGVEMEKRPGYRASAPMRPAGTQTRSSAARPDARTSTCYPTFARNRPSCLRECPLTE